MKKAKLFGLGAATLALGLGLTACGGSKDKTADSGAATSGDVDSKHTVAMVTDIGGVDDRSFNQSAWEGLQAWGKEHGAEEGQNGYMYIQSNDGSEYTTNIDSAVSQGFNTVFGIGYLLQPGIEAAAAQNPDTHFGIIDSVIEGLDNVVSATFKDNESAYLAGIAAAHTTKTNKVGFIGGEEGVVIDRFHAGFVKGVEDGAKSLGKTIDVNAQYAASFGDPAKGKALAADMYKNGADIIYHASGGTGNGIFQEASDLNKSRSGDDKVWVIGVDSDQQAEGAYKNKDGEDDNFTLTSTLKGVGAAVQDISTLALNDKFPGGEHKVYGLKDGGVDITDGFLSDDAKAAVKEAKQNVIDGKVEVPEKP